MADMIFCAEVLEEVALARECSIEELMLVIGDDKELYGAIDSLPDAIKSINAVIGAKNPMNVCVRGEKDEEVQAIRAELFACADRKLGLEVGSSDYFVSARAAMSEQVFVDTLVGDDGEPDQSMLLHPTIL